MNRTFKRQVGSDGKDNFMGIDEYLMMVAKEETKTSVIMNRLTMTDFSSEKIASIVEVTVDFVDEVRRGCAGLKSVGL
jgi:hypothetical protein